MSSCKHLLTNAEPHGHLVQFYEMDAERLTNNVSHYLWEGLQRGDGQVVIATPVRTRGFVSQLDNLGVDTAAAIRDGNLLLLDAQETLSAFMVDGMPDWNRFQKAILSAMRRVGAENKQRGLRAYGEMVGVLWTAGRFSAAIQLEQFWNKLLAAKGFNLFCGYPIDIFSREFQIADVDALLCAHTHVVAAANNGDLETAIDRSLDDVLGDKAEDLKRLMQLTFRPSWAAMPRGEALILWLRNNLPDQGDHIVGKAREYYQAELPLAS
jgi:hypothetical protein